MKKTLGTVVLIAALALAGVALAQRRAGSPRPRSCSACTPISPARPPPTASPRRTPVKMRFDEVNEKGGIHGRKIKLIVEDTQYQVPRAVQAGSEADQPRQDLRHGGRRWAPP